MFSLGYFGVYHCGAKKFTLNSLQASLNRAAEPIAQKYGIKKPDEYA